MEAFHERRYQEAGIFSQYNQPGSTRDVLCGIHYQLNHPQGKIVRVVKGKVSDVAADLWRNSPTFGKFVGEIHPNQIFKQLWVPPGFGHDFMYFLIGQNSFIRSTKFIPPSGKRQSFGMIQIWLLTSRLSIGKKSRSRKRMQPVFHSVRRKFMNSDERPL